MAQTIQLKIRKRVQKAKEPLYPLRSVKQLIIDFAWAAVQLSKAQRVTKRELRTMLNEAIDNAKASNQ